MGIPFGVASCLYFGILSRMEYLKRDMESKNPHSVEVLWNYYYEIKSSVEFYTEHWGASSKRLTIEFEAFDKAFQEYVAKAAEVKAGI